MLNNVSFQDSLLLPQETMQIDIQGSHYILPNTTFFLLPQIKQRKIKKVNMIIKLFTQYISFQRLPKQ